MYIKVVTNKSLNEKKINENVFNDIHVMSKIVPYMFSKVNILCIRDITYAVYLEV